jgi:effector-binding domain-containing protein
MRRFVVVCFVLSVVIAAGCETAPATPPMPKPEFPAAVYDFPGATVLALAEQGPYADFEVTMERLIRYYEEKGIEPQGEIIGVFFDDPMEIEPDKTTYEVRVPVPEGTEAEAPFVVMKTETAQHAMVRFVGPYDKIRDHIAKLYVWIDDNGYEVDGPIWEIYLEHAGTGVPPAQYDTEIHVPVRPMEMMEVPEEGTPEEGTPEEGAAEEGAAEEPGEGMPEEPAEPEEPEPEEK